MKFIYYSPSEVPNEIVIFILPRAVVRMKMDVGFAKSMVLKVMMNITNRKSTRNRFEERFLL